MKPVASCIAACTSPRLIPRRGGAAGALALAAAAPAPRADDRAKTAPPPATPRPGGYYLDDGPGANPPADLDSIPDAVPQVRAAASAATRGPTS